MKIAVLDLCIWLPEFQSGQARFGDVIATWISQGLNEAELTVFDIVEGADFPNLESFDGFILSGSDKGTYDDAEWMSPLRRFLLDARATNKPLFGICFGHQIMADVFGGKSQKVGEAEVGVRAFELEGEMTTAHVWHQDQVTKVPPGASVIASADYCPVAGLAYDFPALSVQFHPEYRPDYIATFIGRSRGQVLSEEVSDDVVAQMAKSTVEADLFVKQVTNFFRTHIG